jgi:hypothetical protein
MGVATLGIGFSASCLVAFLGSSAQKMASCVGVATPIVGACVLCCMCHVVCHPGGHISLNIIKKTIPKPQILTKTETRDNFRVCDLSFWNILSETNKFYIGVFFLLCLVLELHKTSSSELEPRTVFGVVAFVSIISSSKQTSLVLAPFFCRAWYRSKRNHLHWESNPEQFFGVLFFVSVIFSSKQTTLVLAPFFYRA